MEKVAEWFDINVNPFVGKLTGFRVVRNFPKLDEIRNYLIKVLEISTAIDGGANQGQWASRLRRENRDIRIISFEPVSAPYKYLHTLSSKDSLWSTFNFALGDTNEVGQINLASNEAMSSSIFDPTRHKEDFPNVKFQGFETIEIKRLDSLDLNAGDGNLLLKLDVQGYEINALKGAEKLLNQVALIEIETAFHPMYDGELKHSEILKWLEDRNFEVYSIGQPSLDAKGRVGYVDCLLINSSLDAKFS